METHLATDDGTSLRQLVETVYRLRYGIRADHPAVRRTLGASQLL
jgi:hypothetical protein